MSSGKGNRKKIKLWLKAVLILLPAIVGVFLLFILSFFPYVTEIFFSRGVFFVLSNIVGFISGLFPFSVTEILLYIIIAAILLCVILMILKKIKVRAFFKGVAVILSCCFFLCVVFYGINFYRMSIYDLMGYDKDITFSARQVYEACIKIGEKAEKEKQKLSTDKNGHMILSENISITLKNAKKGYMNIVPEYEFLFVPSTNVKEVMISPLWSYTGVSGIYIPVLCEPNINTDVPACQIPFNASHELAHACGFAREDECNFIAYIACVNSDSTDYRYSGYLSAYVYLSKELWKIDRNLYSDAYTSLSSDVKVDIIAIEEYWQQFDGKLMDVSEGINDTFIKAHGVKNGVLSYDDVTFLILCYEAGKG